MIDQLLNDIAVFIANLVNQISNYMASVVNKIVEWVTGTVAYITNAVNNAINQLSNFITKLQQTISDIFNKLIPPILDAITTYINRIIGPVLDILNRTREWIENAIAWVRGLVNIAINYVANLVEDVVRSVKGFVDGVAAQAKALYDGIVAYLKGGLDQLISVARQGIDAVAAVVTKTVGSILDATSALVEGINQRLTDVREGFKGAAESVLRGVTHLSDEVLAPVLKMLREYLEANAESVSPTGQAKLLDAFHAWTSGHSLALYSREEAQNFWQSNMPNDRVGRWVFMLISQVLAFILTYQGVASANSEVILQEFAAVYPYKLLPPADLATAVRKGRLQVEVAKQQLRRQGFSDADADIILDITQTIPGAGDLLSAWHRKLIDDAQLDRGLSALGILEPYAGALKGLSFQLPPVQDIITMAVREVFSPNQRQSLTLDADFPDEFGRQAALQGLTLDWARNYWAAHWQLPSIEQGFEMLHRGAIDEATLDGLIKAQDIAPVWREPLKQITYLPFTRVDIRRMHQVGVLRDEDLVRAHLDLGYAPEKAAQLADFVLRLNKGKVADPDNELATLTRSTILGFYGDGLLTADRARALLVGIGLTAEAAALFIQQADLEHERTRRKQATDLVVDRYSAGAITFEQAIGQLNALNLTAAEIERATARLVSVRERGTKLPTRTEAEAMMHNKIINRDAYRDLLSRLGYAPLWVDAFTRLAEAKDGASKVS